MGAIEDELTDVRVGSDYIVYGILRTLAFIQKARKFVRGLLFLFLKFLMG